MSRSELKAWAKQKMEGHKLDIWVPIIIVGAIGAVLGMIPGANIFASLVGYFIGVGFVIYMLNLINDKEFKLEMLWSQTDNILNILKVYLLQFIYTFLWTLLFIIPGIIKGIGYSLTSYLLADEKYKNKPTSEILKTSEEMMKGHKMEYFMLNLSFIGWYFVGCLTFGIYFIWLVPWMIVADTKFLSDVKSSYEGNNVSYDANSNNTKYCPSCGQQIDGDARFCTNCGKEV